MLYQEKDLSLKLLNVFSFTRAQAMIQERPRDFHALSIRIRGSGRFEYENRVLEVGQGQLVYVPAGRGYRVTTEYEEVLALHFQLWGYESREIESFTPADSGACEALLRRILAEWERRQPGSGYRCTAMAYELLAQLYTQTAEAPGVEECRQKIRVSLEYLEAHFADPDLTVEQLAALSAMSGVYFRFLFRQVFQTSPRAYLVALRTERAKELLASGYYSVTETAERSGFADQKYFSTLFRKKVGMTPRQYAASRQ